MVEHYTSHFTCSTFSTIEIPNEDTFNVEQVQQSTKNHKSSSSSSGTDSLSSTDVLTMMDSASCKQRYIQLLIVILSTDIILFLVYCQQSFTIWKKNFQIVQQLVHKLNKVKRFSQQKWVHSLQRQLLQIYYLLYRIRFDAI